MKAYLSIAAIFRNESPYLAEWIDFHISAGVEHFYLYDNTSTDDYQTVLRPYIDRNIVTLISWPIAGGQIQAYNEALRSYGKQSNWIAFIDADEFLISPLDSDTRPILRRYEAYPAVCVNWILYGSSGFLESPAMPVTHAYIRRGGFYAVAVFPHLLKTPNLDPAMLASYRPINTHIKTILHPWTAASCTSPHTFSYTAGHAVTELCEPITGPWSKSVSVARLRLNHYWCKSAADARRKFERGRATGAPPLTWDAFIRTDKVLNDVVDPIAAQRFPLNNP